jgi:hypothetical protein
VCCAVSTGGLVVLMVLCYGGCNYLCQFLCCGSGVPSGYVLVFVNVLLWSVIV